jgi:hypothetical protein
MFGWQGSSRAAAAIDDFVEGAAAGEALAALPPWSGHWFFTPDRDNISAGRSFAADGHLHAGDVLFQDLDDKAGALASYRRASEQNDALLAHDPENAAALGRRGMLSYRSSLCLFALGRQREARDVGSRAVAQLEKGFHSDPNNIEVHFTLIVAKARAGLHEQASKDAEQLRAKVQGIDVAIAEVFAQCAFGIAQGRPYDQLNSGERSLYDHYLAQALAILHEAAKRHELSLDSLKHEVELQPVRESQEFEALVKEASPPSAVR